jgi:hypothetical protein
MSQEKLLNNSFSKELLPDICSSQNEIERARRELKRQFEWIKEILVVLPILFFRVLVERPIHASELSYVTGIKMERLVQISQDLSVSFFPINGLIIFKGKNLSKGTRMVKKDLKYGEAIIAVPKKVGRPRKNIGESTKLLKLIEKESKEIRELISSPNSSAIKGWFCSFFHLIEDSLPLVVQGTELWFNFCYEELEGMYSRFLEVVGCISPELKAKTEAMLFPILSGIGDVISDPQVIQKIKNAIPTIWSEWMDKMNKLNEKQYLEEALLSTYKERGELASRLNFYISEMPKAFKANGPV